MNRRITSIFLHDFEAFKELFVSITQHKQMDQIKFALHKIKPSLVIFELDDLINQYDELMQIAQTEGLTSQHQEKLSSTIKETEIKIGKVKNFLASL